QDFHRRSGSADYPHSDVIFRRSQLVRSHRATARLRERDREVLVEVDKVDVQLVRRLAALDDLVLVSLDRVVKVPEVLRGELDVSNQVVELRRQLILVGRERVRIENFRELGRDAEPVERVVALTQPDVAHADRPTRGTTPCQYLSGQRAHARNRIYE